MSLGNNTTACIACGSLATTRWSPEIWTIPGRTKEFRYQACPQCSTISCDPLPTDDDLAYYYGNHFDYGWYRQRARLKQWQAMHRWQRVRPVLGGGRLLDIGCGHGHFVAQAARDGCDAWGIDYPSAATDFAIKSLKLNIVQDDINSALQHGTLAEGSFDAITAWHCLEHVRDPHRFLAGALQLLKPGGKLLVALPNASSTGMMRRRERWTWCQQPYLHVAHYTPAGLRGIVENAGLAVRRIWTRDTWDANWLADEVLGDGPRTLARKLNRLNWRVGFAVEEGTRLLAYGISGFPHWALKKESSTLERAELLVLAQRPADLQTSQR
jgi:SAM-dependent methyltransferase